MSNLEIIEKNHDNEFNFGEEKVFTYELKNISENPIKYINLSAFTINPNREPTKINYVTKVDTIRSILPPGKSVDFNVTVEVPENYNEKYITKSGELKTAPIAIKLSVDCSECYVFV